MTDKEYIKKFIVNDQTAMAVFYDRAYPKFISYFRNKYNKTEDYSMDLFHDSYMAMYDNILCHKLTPENLASSLYQYLLGIAIRKMQAGDRKIHEFDKIPLYQTGSEDEMILNTKVQKRMIEEAREEESEKKLNELKDFVEQAVSVLPSPCNEILRYFYWDRMSGNEIASVMNYSNADSVKTQKNKCMKKIKPIVEQFHRL
ncbi:MAG: sigma-70 family RNA polymerase sigma factor [Bacteroidales bacterium]|nr:sigma-70 family RNA polymerase sigma factor [Bacteroidales bacterium]